MILRMGFDRALATLGLMRPKCRPFLFRHCEVDTGKHHQSIIRKGDIAQQPRHSGRRNRDACRHDSASPTVFVRRDQAVGCVVRPDRFFWPWPAPPASAGEWFRAPLTMSANARRDQPRPASAISPMWTSSISNWSRTPCQIGCQPGCQPHRFRRIDRIPSVTPCLLHKTGEDQMPFHRFDRWRNGLGVVGGVQRCPQPVIKFGIADRDHARQQ